MSEEIGNVKVLCRFRPLNEKELRMSSNLCASFPEDGKSVILPSERSPFIFDHVFAPTSTQSEVYKKAAEPIVKSVMEGFNGTVFAYGQTSSGKTFTMAGPSIEDEELKGVIPRMVETVFGDITQADDHIEFSVSVAYAEIYLEKIRDLIHPSKTDLKIHEDKNRGVYISELTEHYVSSDSEVYELMREGTNNREVGFTNMNAGSSRSHSIFILTISQTHTVELSAKTGKLYLVDLAGSEKVGKTGAEGKRLQEAKNINKSLTTLGQVISALTDGKSTHVPYRDSKLTRVLQDSLGGNSKTSLIVTCSPSPYNEAETLSTLRFGVRAKAIRNKAKVNKEYTVDELKLMLAAAKEELAKKNRIIESLGGPKRAQNEDSNQDVSRLSTDHAESSLSDMVTEIEETRNRLSQEIFSHSRVKSKNEALKSNMKRINLELIRMQDLNEQHKGILESKETELKNSEQQVKHLLVTKGLLESELENANANLLNLQNSISEKKNEDENLLGGQTIKEVMLKIELLQEENSILERKLQERDRSHSMNDVWEEEKLSLEHEQKVSQTRINLLEEELKEVSKNYGELKDSMREDEFSLRIKAKSLENNLENLKLVYNQLMNQKTSMKVENLVKNRKIEKMNGQINALEDRLTNANKALIDEQEKVQALNQQLEKKNKNKDDPAGNSRLMIFRKIKKPLRGGGKHRVHFSPQYS